MFARSRVAINVGFLVLLTHTLPPAEHNTKNKVALMFLYQQATLATAVSNIYEKDFAYACFFV
jgi:hypothetical protein